KPKVFSEIARVLKPGGRIGISDVVAEDRLTPQERADRGSYVGCIAGALSFDEYERGLRDAGFTAISITSAGTALDGIHNAIVKATKDPSAQPSVGRTELPVVQGCCREVGRGGSPHPGRDRPAGARAARGARSLGLTRRHHRR